MKTNREEMLAKAKERGYDLWMSGADGSWYSFVHDHYSINLELFVDTEEFKLNHSFGMLTLSTGKCGSFMNDEHFRRFQREMRRAVFNLQ